MEIILLEESLKDNLSDIKLQILNLGFDKTDDIKISTIINDIVAECLHANEVRKEHSVIIEAKIDDRLSGFFNNTFTPHLAKTLVTKSIRKIVEKNLVIIKYSEDMRREIEELKNQNERSRKIIDSLGELLD